MKGIRNRDDSSLLGLDVCKVVYSIGKIVTEVLTASIFRVVKEYPWNYSEEGDRTVKVGI
jgi:hypothetical protein